ncbi:MAG: DNA-binding transcriptional LysR family regulator [Oleispira sp.]|jgi:DNA-binding transcriptional LysR family regulator
MSLPSRSKKTMPQVSLEQWSMFITVIEEGSFQAAADKLLKSQSSISYAMQKMQQGLGVKVFEHKGRKAVLTDAGKLMLQRAKDLIHAASAAEKVAADFSAGWEPQIGLVLNDMFPSHILHSALKAFGEQCPQTRLEIYREVLSGVDDKLRHGEAQIAIDHMIPSGMVGEPIIELEFVRVAHPDHALHHLGRAIYHSDMKLHRQIVIRDSGNYRRENRGYLGSDQRWTVANMREALELLKLGLGSGVLARSIAQPAINTGELRELDIDGGSALTSNLNLIFSDKANTGPAALLLAKLLKEAAKNNQSGRM